MSIPNHTQVKKRNAGNGGAGLALRGLSLLCMLAVLGTQQATAADAKKLLERIRFSQTQGEVELQGQLRSNNRKDAFQLAMRGDRIIYAFRTPPRTFQLQFGSSGAVLSESTRSGTRVIRGKDREETLFDTDVSLADLCLDFLYWPNAAVVGKDRIKGRHVDVLDLQPGRGESNYSRVRVWADQASGALMRIEAYNDQQKLLKKLEVVEVQPWQGSWILRRMRIEAFNPDTGKVKSRSYLEIDEQNRVN